MARCGCTSTVCSCAMDAGTNTTVTGSGSAAAPFRVHVSNEAIQDAVGAALGDGLIYDDVGNLIKARISTDVTNRLVIGTDTGLFVATGNNAAFLDAFHGARQAGMSAAQAYAIAKASGLEPIGFNPNTEPFTPLAVSYETSLALADWSHTLAGADNVFEQITELPNVQTVEPGVYLIKAEARGNVGLQAGAAVSTAAITGQVYKNGVAIAGTQFRLSSISKTAVASPVINTESSGSITFTATLAANDILTLWGSRVSTAPQQTTISSNANGRTRITAVRIRL